ncbi:DNA polymerase delta catalytic subunit [Monocercomonoides exilis]|uniref:DNA polymerase delta catalytic subunit n=1 Tax=Monocercomonoides exilis TaxID=2049356 RepID=UPI00355A483F|nr:DNA polymerase delta catalytic subunit [Monocercomonoides exilis]|eukprot:MONOS_11341.1-p1 / transcript=MONOS_11341.1 / gene=MONOS_11341 / organism=Monocercomonoides_exilis_PA203 / gene_product=DNA polymerase delta catalytic subunit / transcript_product=DNA polymerase delta catalytic subunit / location=Mono_scaffold00564:7540-11390(+) / protein_length=1049 / sequence_SO=supercontig / SO=protein_coding / is_pseudo=false
MSDPFKRRNEFQQFARPRGNIGHDETKSLVFQWIDTDYTVLQEPLPDMPGSRVGQVPCIRFYGITEEGTSVLVNCHGFTPYLYIQEPPNFTSEHIKALTAALNIHAPVHSIHRTQKMSIYNYHDKLVNFLKIFVQLPWHVPVIRQALKAGVVIEGYGQRAFQTYESNIDFVLRHLFDAKAVGCSWVELPANEYKLRGNDSSSPSQLKPSSTCHLEADIAFHKLIFHPPDGKYMSIAPFRVLSFDIECVASQKGTFPQPEKDKVIQICATVAVYGKVEPLFRIALVLNTCTPIIGAHVFSYATEEELLNAWADLVTIIDPDILTGYNIMNFDIPYLYKRATALKCTGSHKIGRITNSPMTVKLSSFHSNQQGHRETHDISIDGRVMIDMLTVMQNDYRLSSYSLNSVSQKFLGEQKEDVHWTIIGDLFEKDAESRQRLAVYCLKDSLLPWRLMTKLMVIVNFVEMARVTGVPMSYLSIRGQQVRVVSQLYRKAAEHNMLIPVSETGISDDKYQGATVIDPLRGYYEDPIVTLDFSSLYPSIMICHNLCYSTLLRPDQVGRMNPNDYVKSPSGNFFVKASVKRGILPIILEDLLKARAKAKKEMKEASDPFNAAVLNGRQLAMKVVANSVYGFTGAQVGKLPCLEISRSVTAFGREMILKTKNIVETHYVKANGFEDDAIVVYGDTDSVMVKFGMKDLHTAMERGREAAAFITSQFAPPVKLEFEKVYWPYLLMSKKRYAGLFWTKEDKFDKIDTKGIETVRRDNCPMVRLVVETCLQKILVARDLEGAQNFAKQIIADLLQNKLDMSLLVISKQFSRPAKMYDSKQPHVELAERMRKREGTAPQVGERVFFVIVEGAKGAKGYEKSEDPLYAMTNGIPIDTDYYLEHQLKGPLERLFSPILKERVTSLFEGDHTRIRRKPPTSRTSQSASSALMKFVGVARACINCRVKLTPQETGAVCSSCKAKEGEFLMEAQKTVAQAEEQFGHVMAQCQRCSSSLHTPFLCSSRDCPLFYLRTKVKKDLEDAYECLERFGPPCVIPNPPIPVCSST